MNNLDTTFIITQKKTIVIITIFKNKNVNNKYQLPYQSEVLFKMHLTTRHLRLMIC